MTFAEALKRERRWHRRAVIINLYHKKRILKNKNWSQRATAQTLSISLGSVSEALRLAEAIFNNPILETLTRDEALKVIRNG